jgi:hypothetical protein
MLKLYRTSNDLNQWVAYCPEDGWVVFPARAGGWESRRPARGLDPMFLREVSPSLGVASGLPIPPKEEPKPELPAAALSQPVRVQARHRRKAA